MAKTPEELYKERQKRFLDAVNLKIPDQVPMYLPFGMLGAKYAGITIQEAYENVEKWMDINEKLCLEFEPDMLQSIDNADTESANMLGDRKHRWAGHNGHPNLHFQFIEAEYMKAEEYDAFLENPGDFIFRTYLPRTYSALEDLRQLPPLLNMLMAGTNMAFANPEVINALETAIKAAKHNAEHMKAISEFLPRMKAMGFPHLRMGNSGGLVPFDMISDVLRGLKGSTIDMFRCPDKLLAAEKIFLNNALKSIREAGPEMGSQMDMASISEDTAPEPSFSFFGTHRCSDGFMSLEQFEKFYWSDIKAMMLACIDAGNIVFSLWEGTWDQRLEYLRELPKGKVVAWLDRTDVFKAKEVLRDRMCICGGMPISLLSTGTPEQVKAHTKKLIDVVGKDGGFIMGPNLPMDDANPELVRVWVETTREYGVYR